MSQRRRIQTDIPETEDPDGCPRDGGSKTYDQGGLGKRMSLGRKVRMGGLAILAFLLRDIDVCHLPWPYVSETDVTDGCP